MQLRVDPGFSNAKGIDALRAKIGPKEGERGLQRGGQEKKKMHGLMDLGGASLSVEHVEILGSEITFCVNIFYTFSSLVWICAEVLSAHPHL